MKKSLTFFIAVLMILSILSAGNFSASVTSDGFTVTPLSEDTAEISGYTGEGGNVAIPEKIGDYTVVSVGENAFLKNKNIDSLSIPESVTSIGKSAFAGSYIKSVTMENGVVTLSDNAFRECVYLESISLSKSLESIPQGCFYSCTRLTTLTIPDSVKSIGDSALYGCSHLEEIEIPSSVKVIGSYALANNLLLKSLSLCEGLEEIKSFAFFQNPTLDRVEIPSTVKSIGEYAFAECTSLESVTLNEGLENLGDSAFDTCPAKEIYLPKTLNSIGEFSVGYYYDQDMFDYCKYEDFRIICNEGSLGHAYAADNGFDFVFAEEETTLPTEVPTEIPTKAPTTVPTTSVPQETLPSVETEPSETTVPSESFPLGDVTLDGKLNIKDATAIQKHVASIEVLSDKSLSLADVNLDQKINVKDATEVQKRIAGII